MFKLRSMRPEDVEIVARMVAPDHDKDPEKGFKVAKQHTIEHLEVVPQHCYVVEDDRSQIVGVMVLHPQENTFEIEDFHIREIHRNKKPLEMLKNKLREYLEKIDTEILCCPYAFRRLID